MAGHASRFLQVVKDADSHEIGAFSESDAEGFAALLGKAGLTRS